MEADSIIIAEMAAASVPSSSTVLKVLCNTSKTFTLNHL